jgi:type IV secretion system protein VirB10
MLFVVILALLFVAIIVKSLFFGTTTAPEKPKTQHHEVVASGAGAGDITIAPGSLPAPPSPDSLTQNNNPPPPPPPPPMLTPPTPDIKMQGGQNQEYQKRIHSGLFVGSGMGAKIATGQKKVSGFFGSDPNGAFAQAVTEASSAPRTEATNIGDLDITIAQGKIIFAVLETAIDTDLPGTIRAIVSHDTYAEAGRKILIPKGSRLIGTYNSSIRRGQGRVFIIWTRVIRPDGTDIMIDSPGVDSLGRAGEAGDVDNKFFEIFTTAILTSSLEIGTAAVGQGLFGTQQTTTTNNGTGSTTTESPTSTAMQEAVQNIGQVGSSIVQSVVNLQPTINIDQGTLVNVFVNRELVFPNGDGHMAGFVE